MKPIFIVILSLSITGLIVAGDFIEEGDDKFGEHDDDCCQELFYRKDALETEIGRLLGLIDHESNTIDRMTHELEKFRIEQHNYWTDLKHFMTKTKPKRGARGPNGQKGPRGPRGAVGAKGPPGENTYTNLRTSDMLI